MPLINYSLTHCSTSPCKPLKISGNDISYRWDTLNSVKWTVSSNSSNNTWVLSCVWNLNVVTQRTKAASRSVEESVSIGRTKNTDEEQSALAAENKRRSLKSHKKTKEKTKKKLKKRREVKRKQSVGQLLMKTRCWHWADLTTVTHVLLVSYRVRTIVTIGLSLQPIVALSDGYRSR